MKTHRDRPRGPGRALGWGITSLAALAVAGCASTTGGAPVEEGAALPSAAPASLVFDGATVVDVEQGALVPDQRVVIAGNRIHAMGDRKTVKLPAGVQVVDARGKYLIPGLWDLHTHPRRYTDFFYPLFITGGVTGMRDAGSDVPLDTLLQWRREILAGARVGPPRQLLSGQSIVRRSSCRRRKFLQTCVTDSADAVHLVDSLVTAGADMIKPYGPPKEIFFVIASEARRLGAPFGGHIHDKGLSAAEASDSGLGILDHPNTSGGLDRLCMGKNASFADCQPLADRMAGNNTWFVPTLIRFTNGGKVWGEHSQATFTRFRERIKAFWEGSLPYGYGDWLRDSTAVAAADVAAANPSGVMHLFQETGLPILAGTDAGSPVLRPMPPGFALHAELAMYVDEGLTPLHALQTATLNPAKFLHATDSLGTVAPGKLADLVLLDANPLADITNTTTIRGVMANGRYFDRVVLDSLLIETQAKGRVEPEPFGRARLSR